MSRRKKIKTKNQTKKSEKRVFRPYEVVKHDFVSFENPFPDDIPFEKRLEIIIEIGKQSEIKYQEQYLKLRDYLNEFDPLYLCSFSAYYFARQEEGIDLEAINGSLEFPPFFLEILQCVSLIKERTFSEKPLGDKVSVFKSIVKDLNKSQSTKQYLLAENVKNQDEIGVLLLRTEMMIHTLAVRNWAYYYQMKSIAYELANLEEHLFTNIMGFKAHSLLDVMFSIISLTEKKLNAHYKKTVEFIKANNYKDTFNKYEHAFKQVSKTNNSQRTEIWNRVKRDLKSLKGCFLEHSDYFLPEIYSHSVDEIYSCLKEKITKEEISLVLEKLSWSFGDLSEINKDYIFLDNPIHNKPFIRLNDYEYFSITPHMLHHISVDLFESLIGKEPKIYNSYVQKKGKYLENKVEELFRKSFPKAQVFAGSLWSNGQDDKVYENDIIVIIEEFAIIIECKSGTVSPSAKRGAPDRLIRTIKELVVEPSVQAIRFLNFLKQNPTLHSLKTKSDALNKIDSSKIKYFIPLAITLTNLGSIGCNLKKLVDAKIVSGKLEEMAPCINYTDLEVIFEVLSMQAEKIHYLSRRREFEAHLNFQGDEMDLFGFYLDNGFNIGEAEYDKNFHINLTLKSKELDPYFMGKGRNVKVLKPSLKKTQYWHDLLTTIESLSKNWLFSSFILLNLPLEDQIMYEDNLKKLKKMVLNDECKNEHNFFHLNFGPKRRRYVLVGYPYKNTDINTRNRVINDIISPLKESSIRGFLVIGYNLDRDNYPYSVIVGSLETDFFDSLDL